MVHLLQGGVCRRVKMHLHECVAISAAIENSKMGRDYATTQQLHGDSDTYQGAQGNHARHTKAYGERRFPRCDTGVCRICGFAYFFKPSFLTSALYERLFFCSRYFKCRRRSATSPKRPRRECLSFGFFFKCCESSSILRDRIAVCTSGEPVSSSWRWISLMVLAFFRFVSIKEIIAHLDIFCKFFCRKVA